MPHNDLIDMNEETAVATLSVKEPLAITHLPPPHPLVFTHPAHCKLPHTHAHTASPLSVLYLISHQHIRFYNKGCEGGIFMCVLWSGGLYDVFLFSLNNTMFSSQSKIRQTTLHSKGLMVNLKMSSNCKPRKSCKDDQRQNNTKVWGFMVFPHCITDGWIVSQAPSSTPFHRSIVVVFVSAICCEFPKPTVQHWCHTVIEQVCGGERGVRLWSLDCSSWQLFTKVLKLRFSCVTSTFYDFKKY